MGFNIKYQFILLNKQLRGGFNVSHKFYLYENISDIMKNDSKFINSKGYDIYHDLQFNLKCKKEYYFVLYAFTTGAKNHNIPGPQAFQIIVLNEEKENIYLSPSLSNYYSFKIETKREFFYIHNETKYGLIDSEYIVNITIIENNNIIYENQSLSEAIEFKKNNNYKIIFTKTDVNTSNYLSFINFQFHDEPIFFKHDFNKAH